MSNGAPLVRNVVSSQCQNGDHPDLQYFFAHMHLIGILALALTPALALLAVPGCPVILDSIFKDQRPTPVCRGYLHT